MWTHPKYAWMRKQNFGWPMKNVRKRDRTVPGFTSMERDQPLATQSHMAIQGSDWEW